MIRITWILGLLPAEFVFVFIFVAAFCSDNVERGDILIFDLA